ncbi:hypothetical protein FRC07_000531 [Ceratobasidium sp. 392]|nr:hypothetical protein FRC07_000531 [Ceratobasidium sp. 392]
MPSKSKKSRTSATSGPPAQPKSNKRESITEASPNTASRGTTEFGTNFASPVRLSSGTYSRASSNFTHPKSRISALPQVRPTNSSYALDDGTTSIATSQAPDKDVIEVLLKAEMDGAIFCDPNFVENFLTADKPRLETVLNRCKNDLEVYRFPSIREEKELYEPIAWVLNRIKRAADGDAEQASSLPGFAALGKLTIKSHTQDTVNNKPDVALFDGEIKHWETVRMPIKVKVDASDFNNGLIQLARYARAVFANQLDRRHVYGMLICKWAATFVRFDRSGILYSNPIDMRSQRSEFCEAFAGLMMMDEEAFGYDTAFTTRRAGDGKLEYYIDLPAAAFPSEAESDVAAADASTATSGPSTSSRAPKPPTKRLKVMHILCHRKTIRGRATTALRVREVIRSGVSEKPKGPQQGRKTRAQTKLEEQQAQVEVEVLGTRDYVLKLMWRDPNKTIEGEVLKRLVGIYGVGQYMWHSDVFKACDTPGCGRSMDNSCGKCLDRTPDSDGAWIHRDLANKSDTSKKEQGIEATTIQASERSAVYVQRRSRTYCRLLMSTVGSPLCTAGSPRELLEAILDALLGYWRIVNMGLLHRDISDGNVLMLREDGYNKKEWELPRTTTSDEDSVLTRSKNLLQGILNELGRDPTGMLNDYDLFKTHSMLGVDFFDDSSLEGDELSRDEGRSKRRKLDPEVNESGSNKGKGREESSFSRVAKADKNAPRIDLRTGTPAFMSARVLNMKVGEQYEHHFMDDLESFFWLILLCVAEHTDARGKKANPAAYEVLNKLGQHELSSIAAEKVVLMAQCQADDGDDMRNLLKEFDNNWANDPAIVSVILTLGSYFHGAFMSKKTLSKRSVDTVFPMVVGVIRHALDS